MEEQFFDTSHGRIAFYDNRADGLAIVMLHANSICKESFAPQIAAFGNTYRTIAIDLPGHGGSSDAANPRRSYSMNGYANAVSELLTGIGVTRYAVLGHSLGGHVALELLARHEASITGAAIFGTPPIENSIEGLIAGFVPSPDMAYTGSLVITEEQVGMIARMALGEKDEGNETFLAAIRRADETVVNLDYVDSLSYRNVWTGKPIRLAGTGHAVHREEAQAFNRLLAEFLETIT